LAKWTSPLGDWHDGSAMTHYYETAPLPTSLGWYAHALPDAWHSLETWLALASELLGALAVFGPRRVRLTAGALLSTLMLLILLSASYGFFAYLALALHVFFLDDRDVERTGAWLRDRLRLGARATQPPPRPAPASPAPPRGRVRVGVAYAGAAAAATACVLYVGLSALEGCAHFARPDHTFTSLVAVHDIYRPLRIFNAYHLFSGVTTTRVETAVQIFDGRTWTEPALAAKPGPVDEAPRLLGPHLPRLAFHLWFHRPGTSRPSYLDALLAQVCRHPAAAQHFFAAPLPQAREAVRLVAYRYRYTTWRERRETGAWWVRTRLATEPPTPCREPSP
jgi:hypothetical protein